MIKNLKKIFAAILAIIMCITTMVVNVFAEEGTDETQETIWHGGGISVDVTAGENGYTFMSVYKNPYNAYEMSNHMVSADGEHHDIPQTLMIVDASKDYTWSPNGKYSFDTSNYEVLYCCDAETGYKDGIYYKRINLEDSGYYTEEAAAHIRAIVTNSYPYVSLEQMKANLKAAGFEGAEELTRAEIITAVQSAIWYCTNEVNYEYSRTFNVTDNSQWGGVMHDYTNEMDVWWATGNRKFSTNEEVGARINALIDYLKNQETVYAEKNQIVISKLEIVGEPVQLVNDSYNVALQVALNNSGSSEKDDISLAIYVDHELVQNTTVELGKEVYDFVVEAKAGQTIKAVASGTQTLPEGVYFYEPEGGRDVSQCLVGVAKGETDVYANAQVTLDIEETGTPVTADMKLQKTDNDGNALTGAGFILYVEDEDANLYAGTYAVDENGQLSIEDLLPGSYELVETTVPEGCVALSETINFTIDEEGILKLSEETNDEFVSCSNEDGIYLLTVVNDYIPTEIIIEGEKYLDGELAEGFEFALLQGEDVLESVISKEDGSFVFSPMAFNKVGVYTYDVIEVEGDEEGIIYDDTVYKITVTVTKNGNNLNAAVSYTKDGEVYTGKLTFENETELVELPDDDTPLASLPETGDYTPVGLYVVAFVAAIAFLVIVSRKKQNTYMD